MNGRRLRKVPALVLPQRPHPEQLLRLIQRFDPDAALTKDGITFAAGVRLAPVAADVAEKAGLPRGFTYGASDSGPFQTWLVRGLARRMNGYAYLPQQVIADDPTEVAIVHAPRRISPEELAARLSQYVPELRAEAPQPDGSFFLTTPQAPLQIRCDNPDVPSMRWLLPLTLGELRKEPGLHGYRFGITTEPFPQLIRLVAVAALELAKGVDGVATDRDRFRLAAPDDLL